MRLDRPKRKTHRAVPFLALLWATLPTACGGGASQPEAQLYLNQVLQILRTNHLDRATIDWTGLEAQARATAAGITQISDLKPALQVVFDRLGEPHSFLEMADGTLIAAQAQLDCPGSWADPGTLPADVGYVRITGNFRSPLSRSQLAEAILVDIRAQDHDGLVGWVVDLRSNSGGDVWPMLAGIGVLLGESVAGYVVPPVGLNIDWSYSAGAARSDGQAVVSVANPLPLRAPNPRVAVLLDNAVASSGEMIAIAFRGRRDTRSFGHATCGYTTANDTFPLFDGSRLFVAVAHVADRLHILYSGAVPVDEEIADPSGVVARAIEWLRAP